MKINGKQNKNYYGFIGDEFLISIFDFKAFNNLIEQKKTFQQFLKKIQFIWIDDERFHVTFFFDFKSNKYIEDHQPFIHISDNKYLQNKPKSK